MSMKAVGKLHDLFIMHSQTRTDNSQYYEIPVMNHDTPARRISPQSQPHRERAHLKSGKTIERTEKECALNSTPATPSGNHPKPLASRRVKGVDEVVKYMSSVPSYLQKGENVQEKALNFGVLDWGRLEKWTNHQKQEPDKRDVDSQSSSNSSLSSTVSTFGPTTSRSTRSTDSHLAQREKSPALDPRWNSYADAHPTKLKVGQNSAKFMGNAHSHKKGKINCLNTKGNSVDTSQPPEINSPSCTSIVIDTSACRHNNIKSQNGKLRGADKFKNCEEQDFNYNMDLSENWLQDQCSVVRGMWDHLPGSVHSRRISCDAAIVNDKISAEVTRNSFSGNFFPGHVPFINPSLGIPYSCPLPSTNDVQFVTSPTGILAEKCAINIAEKSKLKSSTPPGRELSPNCLFSADMSRMRNSTSREQITANFTHQDALVSQTAARHSVLPHCFLSSGLSRILKSSLREGSTWTHMKQQTICSDNLKEENVACSSGRRRHSPLRRIIDPLLKSKNQLPFSGPGLRLVTEPSDLSEAKTEPLSGGVKAAEKCVKPTRQALLKLVWKNELLLFVFSVSGTSIAATMGKISIARKNDFECTYTIFTANEVKKKSGVWIGQGNKSKKQDLACNVVGKMRVSCSKSTIFDSKNCYFTREFVLFGNELAPANDGFISSLLNSELAAIVIRVANGTPKDCDLQRNSSGKGCSIGSLQIDEKNESSNQASVVAILPSGIHASSSAGQPSPLIERWKSGGCCDCGGWDEGCQLTILMDKINPGISGSSCSQDGTHRIEMFTQGEFRENKHAFRMTAFTEGVYAVDFGESVTSLQAFAMSIAILHSRKPTTLSALHYSMKVQSIQEHSFTASDKNTHATSRSYIPDRPPLSPVGRA